MIVANRNHPHLGPINVIIKRMATGGNSNSSRNSYARSIGICTIQKNAWFSQSFTFNEEDSIAVATPYDDVLVVVGDIEFWHEEGVGRCGSPANVLIWEAFVELKIFPENLKIYLTTGSFASVTIKVTKKW